MTFLLTTSLILLSVAPSFCSDCPQVATNHSVLFPLQGAWYLQDSTFDYGAVGCLGCNTVYITQTVDQMFAFEVCCGVAGTSVPSCKTKRGEMIVFQELQYLTALSFYGNYAANFSIVSERAGDHMIFYLCGDDERDLVGLTRTPSPSSTYKREFTSVLGKLGFDPANVTHIRHDNCAYNFGCQLEASTLGPFEPSFDTFEPDNCDPVSFQTNVDTQRLGGVWYDMYLPPDLYSNASTGCEGCRSSYFVDHETAIWVRSCCASETSQYPVCGDQVGSTRMDKIKNNPGVFGFNVANLAPLPLVVLATDYRGFLFLYACNGHRQYVFGFSRVPDPSEEFHARYAELLEENELSAGLAERVTPQGAECVYNVGECVDEDPSLNEV